MEKKIFGAAMEVDQNTGLRVLSFVGISNFKMCEEDQGDPDRMRENNDY